MASLLKNAPEDTRNPAYGEFRGRLWETFTSSDSPLTILSLASNWEHHSLQRLVFVHVCQHTYRTNQPLYHVTVAVLHALLPVHNSVAVVLYGLSNTPPLFLRVFCSIRVSERTRSRHSCNSSDRLIQHRVVIAYIC